MKALPIILTLSLAGCAVLDEDERVANLSDAQLKKHCKQAAGKHECGTTDGFIITYEIDDDECLTLSDRYAACTLTVAEHQACVDAIEACSDPESFKTDESVCQSWIECLMTIGEL